MTFSIHDTKRFPLKLWDSHGAFEPQAMDQLRNVAELPFIHSHVAGMPDVHLGKGATIGSVIPTRRAIIPAAVGVDIGCGMMAARTSLTASDLPDNLLKLRLAIEALVPKGNETNSKVSHLRGGWDEVPKTIEIFWRMFESRYKTLVEKYPKIQGKTAQQLGTMGGGNHFIEVCLDEYDDVWIMLHSGSRGLGNRIGSYFIDVAKEQALKVGLDGFLPDINLAFLTEGSLYFDDYIAAMELAQEFATVNRTIMMQSVISAMLDLLPTFKIMDTVINCHHNYAAIEHHFGSNVWVTRKGAVRARKGDLGIIPGSMGTGSFIVEGKGNAESFHSCSHGAGRVMSRTEAKKKITMKQHREAMIGIEGRLDKEILDESPAAYKNIHSVMAAQNDLVTIKYRLRQILNIKG